MMTTKLAVIAAVGGAATYYFTSAGGSSEIEKKFELEEEQTEAEAGETESQPKMKLPRLRNCRFDSGYCGISHPSKRHLNPDPSGIYTSFGAGEDSGFITDYDLGIADGVGGWSQYKYANVSLFSRLLMHHCKEYLDDSDDLVNAMSYALHEIGPEPIGSATCLLVHFDKIKSVYKTHNVGDSNYMIIRGQHIFHKGTITQNGFNFPKQLGTRGNAPTDGVSAEIGAELGDIVILGSDGLWDNMFDKEIVEIINQNTNRGFCQKQDAATGIVKKTMAYWDDDKRDSPFALDAQATGQYYTGAKVDDCVVIVAQLVEPRPKL